MNKDDIDAIIDIILVKIYRKGKSDKSRRVETKHVEKKLWHEREMIQELVDAGIQGSVQRMEVLRRVLQAKL